MDYQLETYNRQMDAFMLPIEKILGYVISEKEAISAIKKSDSFSDKKPEDLLLIREDIGEVFVDTMFAKPIRSQITALVQLGISGSELESSVNLIIKRQVEIIVYSHSIIRYDRLNYLDFSRLKWDTESIVESLSALSFRDTATSFIKSKGVNIMLDRLDEEENKNTLEWRLLRVIVSLCVIKKPIDASILSGSILQQIKLNVR